MKGFLHEAIDRMQGSPVLVIGDMIADVYLDCSISRISREAPVLVLEQSDERIVAGGAANVVNNAASLGGKVYAAGVIGDDSVGKGLISILEGRGVDTSAMVVDRDRATISKTRVIAGGRTTVSQQIVRIDNEWRNKIPEDTGDAVFEIIKSTLGKVRGVVMSDYGSGTITKRIREYVIAYCRSKGMPCIVDSRYDILGFSGASYIKQNDAEAGAAVGYELKDRKSVV